MNSGKGGGGCDRGRDGGVVEEGGGECGCEGGGEGSCKGVGRGVLILTNY